MKSSGYINIALEAAEKASAAILSVYNSANFRVVSKEDNSPLTMADRNAHEIITQMLKGTSLPVLSEEGKSIPFAERSGWGYFWMVDPLDGTKEFISRNGEFTVNIALIHGQTPVMGVVAVPATGEVYYGIKDEGAYMKRKGLVKRLERRKHADLTQPRLRVVASRSHMNSETQAFIQGLTEPSLVSAGSSLKFLLLANGEADVYPRFAPTMEWDTAAAHAIVNETGLKVRQAGRQHSLELLYNKEDLLNPHFIVY